MTPNTEVTSPRALHGEHVKLLIQVSIAVIPLKLLLFVQPLNCHHLLFIAPKSISLFFDYRLDYLSTPPPIRLHK
jgi:hypothetical protein